jgi:TRAP-type C4-dicarboxylate transport system permease small subunit
LRKLAAVSRVLNIFCRSMAGAVMLLMAVLVFAEVISRFVFGISHEFVPAISSWSMVWITFFVLGVAIKTREHINVDLLPTKLPEKYQIPLITFFDIVALFFGVLLCFGGLQYDLMAKASGVHAVTVQFLPMWVARICVPMGGVFLAFFSIEHLINDVWRIVKRSGEAR